jgi:uncharacterized membrane-anchored protein
MKKGLILAAIQLVLAMSVVAKFQYDRETLPRQWMKAEPYDPYMPFRGRYVHLRLRQPDGLVHNVPYFIPEGVPDPSIRARDEELWVEASVPKQGAPRPIRLAVKKNGVMTPLDLQ